MLRLDGKVKGRQYDRLGYLRIGGVEVFRTSTPQPSPDGITWSVEKDVTRYSETLGRDRRVEMFIGNVVTEGGHRLSVPGHLNTSHGRVTTTVRRTLANTSVHRWTEGEALDALKATWTDRETVTTGGRAAGRYGPTGRTRWTARRRSARMTGCVRRSPSVIAPRASRHVATGGSGGR